MRWLVALGLVAGCDKIFGIGEVGNGSKIDAAIDAKVYLDAPPAGIVCAGVAGAPLHICAPDATLQGLTYSSSADIDTETGAGCTRVDPASGRQGALCVIIGTDVTIDAGATLTAHGSRPLVLVAMGVLTINGTVDVSSHRSPDRRGAGADDATCAVANGSIQGAGMSTSGGGGGGSFGSRGGNGGAPSGGTALLAPAPVDPALLALVRGGCLGGAGGTDHSLHTAPGGHSGGAVYLMAGTSISIGGKVLANGGGGAAGVSTIASDYAGGAGGGTGGLIMLDTPSLILSGALVMANGGGGGGGVSDAAASGTPGDDPDPTKPTIAAAGGTTTGDATGGPGGAGATTRAPGPGGFATGNAGAGGLGGGGGGGGGQGVIRIFGATAVGGTIVPAAT